MRRGREETKISSVTSLERVKRLTVETLEIEPTLGLTLPQTKVVCVLGSVT